MRLLLLPISTRRALIYCQRIQEKPVNESSLVQKIINKVPQTWAKWEADGRGWKKTLTEYGNRGLQRIPYQEWGLKSLPPLNDQTQAEELSDNKKFDVLFPANVIRKEDVPKILQRLASERKQLHWQRFIWSLIGMPFTIPLVLIPVIPNIPFFYLAFRGYSHWRALKGSDHLDFLLDHRLLWPISNPQIESIYDKAAPNLLHSFVFVTRSRVLEGSAPKESMLLPAGAHQLVAKALEVPELAAEVQRAVQQVKESVIHTAEQETKQPEAPTEEKEENREGK